MTFPDFTYVVGTIFDYVEWSVYKKNVLVTLVLCRVLVLILEFYVEVDAITQNAICIANEKVADGLYLCYWDGMRQGCHPHT